MTPFRKETFMRAFVACLVLALVAALLVPITGSAQTDAECVAVYDADGTRIARAYTPTDIFFADQGRTIRFGVQRSGITDNAGSLWFTGAGCTGAPFMIWEVEVLQPTAHLVGTDVWYPDTEAVATTRFANSRKHSFSGQCEAYSSNINETVPALNFTLPSYTPPFHLEPEPCTTQPDPSRQGAGRHEKGSAHVWVLGWVKTYRLGTITRSVVRLSAWQGLVEPAQAGCLKRSLCRACGVILRNLDRRSEGVFFRMDCLRREPWSPREWFSP